MSNKTMNSKRLRWVLFLLLLLAIAAGVFYRDLIDAEALQNWVDHAGIAGPLLFMLVYAIGTILFLPGSVLTLAGGALFGPVFGTFYNLTGATLGAAFAFLAARYLASDWVEQKTAGRLKKLKQGVEQEGWRFVAFVRLVPIFPFNLLNYALGLTRIRFRDYVIASYICMLPGAFAYTWLGYAGREAVTGGTGVIQKAMIALALLAGVAFLPRIVKRLRQRPTLSLEELRQQLASENPPLLLDVRTATDYATGHIAAARNVPLESLNATIDELSEYRQSPVALICTTDRRSGAAKKLLLSHGFENVEVVAGGMAAWRKQSWPLDTHSQQEKHT